jgi:ribulose-5-phosphate 4-epimerase/fuculose-1-phosphate aldolase
VLDGPHPHRADRLFHPFSWIHRLNPHAKAVLHTHMPYATALTLVQGGRLEWSATRTRCVSSGRVAYRRHCTTGMALDDTEGRTDCFDS